MANDGSSGDPRGNSPISRTGAASPVWNPEGYSLGAELEGQERGKDSNMRSFGPRSIERYGWKYGTHSN